MSKVPDKQIPTNIITGFLGVGKTTVIQQLLKQKPAGERWAVLVNEFGEVGIDSNLFTGAGDPGRGVTISQVPGGCMCCTNGLPMQMALNLLLAKSKPHRLLIEPTGLGHPKEVLAILSGEYYRNVLNLQATLTLVDARKIQDSRYTSNVTFNQQLEVAEVVVANKADLYQPADFPAFLNYIDSRFDFGSKLVYQVRHGAVSLEWLTHPASQENLTGNQPSTTQAPSTLPQAIETPMDGFVRADNEGEGFFSRGWVFNSDWRFDVKSLLSAIQGIQAERFKGVFITAKGSVGFNKVDSIVTQVSLEDCADSRAEVIASRRDALDGIEEALLDCLKGQVTSAGPGRLAPCQDRAAVAKFR